MHVDLHEAVRADASPSILAAALGPDDRLVAILVRRLREAGLREVLGGGDDDVVVLAAAGSSDPRAVADCREMASRLATALGGDVTCAFISAAAPRLADAVDTAARRHPDSRVVVASYLLAPGYFAGLAAECGAQVVTSPLLTADGPVPEGLVDSVVDRYLAAEREAVVLPRRVAQSARPVPGASGPGCGHTVSSAGVRRERWVGPPHTAGSGSGAVRAAAARTATSR